MTERGCIHIIFPGYIESHSPLNSVEEIDIAISVLGLCRDVAKRRESDIPSQMRIFDETELMVIGAP
jgi:hypothetical protein